MILGVTMMQIHFLKKSHSCPEIENEYLNVKCKWILLDKKNKTKEMSTATTLKVNLSSLRRRAEIRVFFRIDYIYVHVLNYAQSLFLSKSVFFISNLFFFIFFKLFL